jgi:hypothetical protein
MRKAYVLCSALGLLIALGLSAEEDSVKKQDAARRDTIRYGTDGEISALITTLESEKVENLDANWFRFLETQERNWTIFFSPT